MTPDPNPSPELRECPKGMEPIRDEADACERNGVPCWLWHRLWTGPMIGHYHAESQWWRVLSGNLTKSGDVDMSEWTGVGIFPSHWCSLHNPPPNDLPGWEPFAALSPQTLPAPGEVEQKIGISDLLDADISARAKAHVAAMAIVTADPIAALKSLATVAAANDEGVAREGPLNCMWRSGHDGEGPDPSRFFCDVIGPAPSCHLYRAVADTETEARALAFRKADPSFMITSKATNDIILVSQDAEPGYQLHGLFSSFRDAADHAAKDEDNEHTPVWLEGEDRQQWITARTVWVAARQPIRVAAAIRLLSQGGGK